MISQSAQLIRKVLGVVLFASLAAACSSNPTMPSANANTAAQHAANIAIQQVGVRYRYGGASPSGFDCSGLIQYAYANAGKRIPRTAAAQWKTMRPVASDDLRVGDVLFFRIAGKMSHVGLYVGDGRFVHAPSTGRAVAVASLRSDFYVDRLVGAGRPD
jgi:cell wall-associated NlpC family hydrolase